MILWGIGVSPVISMSMAITSMRHTGGTPVPLQAVDRAFTYVADGPLKSVSLAGTFNNWDKGATPMSLGADGRTWTTSLKLPYGRVQYKFVLDGERWIVDPKGKTVDDGNGHQNSETLVVPPDFDVPASPMDDKVARSGLRHRLDRDVNVDRGQLIVRLRTRAKDVSQVVLQTKIEGIDLYTMRRVSRDELFDVYEARLRYPQGRQVRYSFLFGVAGSFQGFGIDGLTTGLQGAGGDQAWFVLPASFRPFRVPAWPEGGVVYQIFPDRFANGDKKNDLPGTLPWNARKLGYASRLGGDVAGIRAHLDYLANLGIKTVYYTPVFDSPSYHRYDARSYTKIAPDFGTNADFGLLTKQTRARGMRTVMDFAFNHTATDGPWFMDLRQKGEASRYRDFYFPKSFPIQVKPDPNYVAWFGFPSMPKLNATNPAVQKACLAAIDYWRQNASLAGVRLDVANEVEPSMWRALRRHTKATSPDFWIVGENWGDGTPWFGGDQWDSQMGYQFRDAALGFFAEGKTKPSQFLDRLMAVYAMYPPQVSRNLMTLIGSHDTPRFLTLCKGDGDLHRLATTVLLSWPGSPMLYYGDELGMTGGADPMNRKGMEWSRVNAGNATLRFTRRMIAVRNANPALQSGDPSILLANDAANTLAFARTLDATAAAVALNRSATARKISLVLPAPLKGKALLDALSGKRYAPGSVLSLDLGPRKAAILVPASGPNLAFKTPF